MVIRLFRVHLLAQVVMCLIQTHAAVNLYHAPQPTVHLQALQPVQPQARQSVHLQAPRPVQLALQLVQLQVLQPFAKTKPRDAMAPFIVATREG